MRARALVLAVAAMLALAAPVAAGDGMEQMGGAAAGPARALALQALALLEQGSGREQAVQKLDQALAAADKDGVNPRALRRAHAALHREADAEATRLIRDAFPAGSSHVVGVTFRPQIATARVAAGLAGAVAIAAAAAGLLSRRRSERPRGLA